MKPVNRGEIAAGDRLSRHRKGRQVVFPVVFLVATCQRQLGIRRNLPFTPVFAAATAVCLVWSLIPTEDCVRLVTWHNLCEGLGYF